MHPIFRLVFPSTPSLQTPTVYHRKLSAGRGKTKIFQSQRHRQGADWPGDDAVNVNALSWGAKHHISYVFKQLSMVVVRCSSEV